MTAPLTREAVRDVMVEASTAFETIGPDRADAILRALDREGLVIVRKADDECRATIASIYDRSMLGHDGDAMIAASQPADKET